MSDEDSKAALRTCQLRGWVEVVHDAVPHATLGENAELPQEWERTAAVYRLTEAGWHAINRTHAWIVATLIVAAATLVASGVGTYLVWLSMGGP